MTHFIVTSIGTFGDIFPFAQVAIALQNLGQKVTFITNPYFRETIERYGLDFYGIGSKDQYMKVLLSEGLWNDKEHLDVVMSLFVPNLFGIDEMVSKIDPSKKVVIIAQQNFLPNAGIAQAKRKNVTVMCGALYPSVFRTSPKKIKIGPFFLAGPIKNMIWGFVSKKLDRQYIQLDLIKPLNELRKENGLRPISGYPGLFNQVASFNVLLFSSWFGDNNKEWPKNLMQGDFILREDLRSEGFPNELKKFLDADEKPILFTFGTGNMHAQQYLKASLESLKISGRKAIFICKDRTHLPQDLPENILWLPHFDNFNELLDRCSLIVYHGGIGTLAEAARCGIPQLAIPSLGDQWDNAERIERLHLGGAIPIQELNQSVLTQKIDTILHSPKILQTCKKIQEEMSRRVSAETIAQRIIDAIAP